MKRILLVCLSCALLPIYCFAKDTELSSEDKNLITITIDTREYWEFKILSDRYDIYTLDKRETYDSYYANSLTKIEKLIQQGYEIVSVLPITFTDGWQKGSYDSCPCDKQYTYTKYERWILKRRK